jgi:O-methyltransferase
MSDSRLGSVMRRLRRSPKEAPAVEDSRLATLTPVERSIIEQTLPHSITSRERIVAVMDAVRYVVDRDIPGGLAECGVWRGGSIMAMILTLQDLGRDDRDLYLYDTFEGMTPPTEADGQLEGKHALEIWNEAEGTEDRAWGHFFNPEIFNEDVVRENVLGTGYPAERVHFVRGKVEDTLPGQAPDEVALLRLDTDWYESTKHELVHLYPRLSDRGVLIIDDYGHWKGSRKAVDEYFAGDATPILLNRIDYTGRIGVKG